MASTVMHSQVTFEHLNGLPRDRFVMDFNFLFGSTADSTSMAGVETRLSAFFNSVATGASYALSHWMAPCFSRSIAPVIRWYDVSGHLNGSPVGSPERISTLATLGAAVGGGGLPSEVALCVTYRQTYSTVEFGPGGTRPRARQRGRLFFGPLVAAAQDTDAVGGRVHPISTVQTDLVKAAKVLGSSSATDRWAVWSRTNADFNAVQIVQVDDAFDTQRRRGERAISKLTETT